MPFGGKREVAAWIRCSSDNRSGRPRVFGLDGYNYSIILVCSINTLSMLVHIQTICTRERLRETERNMEALAELERVQIQILRRITELELRLLPQQFSTAVSVSSNHQENGGESISSVTSTESRLSSILRANGVRDFLFKRVPSDYYNWPFEDRREILGAASIHHLCKSIVLVNTQAQGHVTDCRDRNNSKYYVVVVQYTARFSAEAVKNFLYSLNNGVIPKKKFNLRLAPEESSLKLTGYEHNGVTCINMKTEIPVILDEAIARLNPDFFWLGGGEIDLKLGFRTSEFINFVKPFIVSCSST